MIAKLHLSRFQQGSFCMLYACVYYMESVNSLPYTNKHATFVESPLGLLLHSYSPSYSDVAPVIVSILSSGLERASSEVTLSCCWVWLGLDSHHDTLSTRSPIAERQFMWTVPPAATLSKNYTNNKLLKTCYCVLHAL